MKNLSLFLIIVVVMMITLIGCTMHWTKDITEKLQPAELYKSYEVKPVNLKALSKCPLPPSINIVNVETREEDYFLLASGGITNYIKPKELTSAIVGYLKHGFEKSQIMVDSNSSKIINISLIDAKVLRGIFSIAGNIETKFDIPETKYSGIHEATEWSAAGPIDKLMAYAIHSVTRQIINDPVIQDYILCKAEYTDKSLSQKLQELQTALDNGLISKEEYQRSRQRLLEKY